jgi:hypothetical protein
MRVEWLAVLLLGISRDEGLLTPHAVARTIGDELGMIFAVRAAQYLGCPLAARVAVHLVTVRGGEWLLACGARLVFDVCHAVNHTVKHSDLG